MVYCYGLLLIDATSRTACYPLLVSFRNVGMLPNECLVAGISVASPYGYVLS